MMKKAWAAAGLAASLGTGTSLMLTVAHELLHSPRALDKAMCNLLLSAAGYMHWSCSHLAHHRMARARPHHLDLPVPPSHSGGSGSGWRMKRREELSLIERLHERTRRAQVLQNLALVELALRLGPALDRLSVHGQPDP